jgi:nicotinamidase-related amidase
MPVTALDPTTALVVIDLQAGVAAAPTIAPMPEIVGRSRTLIDAFRARGLPVVLVTVDAQPPGRTETPRHDLSAYPAGWTELLPELAAQPDDILITKHTRSAFPHTALQDELERRGVTQIVLAGIATSGGVESTGRDAHELGFHVTFATDAMTDTRADHHRHALEEVFPRIGERGTTDEILALLERRHA